MSEAPAAQRIDKWLWAARFYKTRSLAADAVEGGKVHVNSERAKPARQVKACDTVFLRKPPYEFTVQVLGLSERRGPAPQAQQLYEETPDSSAARRRLSAEMKEMPAPLFRGRPTKKDRRTMARFIETNQTDEEPR